MLVLIWCCVSWHSLSLCLCVCVLDLADSGIGSAGHRPRESFPRKGSCGGKAACSWMDWIVSPSRLPIPHPPAAPPSLSLSSECMYFRHSKAYDPLHQEFKRKFDTQTLSIPIAVLLLLQRKRKGCHRLWCALSLVPSLPRF